jgi:hypothetical protein
LWCKRPREKENHEKCFPSAEEKGIKIHSLVVNRPSHTVYMVAESETFEEIDKMFEPILTMTDAIITPVMPMTLD